MRTWYVWIRDMRVHTASPSKMIYEIIFINMLLTIFYRVVFLFIMLFQLESTTNELASERSTAQRLESAKMMLERQVGFVRGQMMVLFRQKICDKIKHI